MNVDSILLSEYASVASDGRFTVANAFNRLHGPGPKWGVPIIYVSLVIHGHREEAGTEHELELRLINARREVLMPDPPRGHFTFPAGEGMLREGLPLRTIYVLALIGIVFEEPGPYAVEAYIDGTYHASASMYVERIPQTPAG